MLYEYSDDAYVFVADCNLKVAGTEFDKQLQSKWNICVNEGLFRYNLNGVETRRLAGAFKFLAQLNTGRAFNRRPPESIESMDQPVDHSKFNFTKARSEEYLLAFKREGEDVKHFLLINISPIEYCHCLLLPDLHQCLPQMATLESIELAVQILLLSSSSALRVLYNGLCAFASVNHLHYHLYYLQHHMLLEDIEVDHLVGPCYVVTKYPAPCFVFGLQNKDVGELARSVYRLTQYLQDKHIPHNMCMIRGATLNPPSQGSVRNCVRVYVWARTPVSDTKDTAAFNPAASELFGHILVKTQEQYKQLSEEKAAIVISDACQETFKAVKDQVKQLFSANKVSDS